MEYDLEVDDFGARLDNSKGAGFDHAEARASTR